MDKNYECKHNFGYLGFGKVCELEIQKLNVE